MSPWTLAWILALLSALAHVVAKDNDRARVQFALEVALYAVLLRVGIAIFDAVCGWAGPRLARGMRELRRRAGAS